MKTPKNLLICKLKDSAVIPKKYLQAGWFDLYACFDEMEMVIQPHETVLIPTGIASVIPINYRVSFCERGSNSKWCGIVQSGRIDCDYRGEWFVAIYNGNDIPVEITKNVDKVVKTEDFISVPYSKAICQFAIEKTPNFEIVEIDKESLNKESTKRGAGCLGSSNR